MKSIRRSRSSQTEITPAFAPSRNHRSECLACRTLLIMARQRKGLDGARCQLIFKHLDTARELQSTLHRTLAEHELSELQFAVLVALFAREPEAVIPADLADYTAVSRPAITDTMVRLEALGLITRGHDPSDRRIRQVQLTEKGRDRVDRAMVNYLQHVGRLARHIEPTNEYDLLTAYEHLQRGAAELSA